MESAGWKVRGGGCFERMRLLWWCARVADGECTGADGRRWLGERRAESGVSAQRAKAVKSREWHSDEKTIFNFFQFFLKACAVQTTSVPPLATAPTTSARNLHAREQLFLHPQLHVSTIAKKQLRRRDFRACNDGARLSTCMRGIKSVRLQCALCDSHPLLRNRTRVLSTLRQENATHSLRC